MASQCLQVLGFLSAFAGWVGTILVCALPMWRVTAFVGANIVTAQVIWEGLWMNCVTQSTGQMQCKMYDSMLALPQDLQAARAMVVISVMAGLSGALTAVAGGDCTSCMEDRSSKAKACLVSGAVFVLAALLVLAPVSWSAHALLRDFYNPLVPAARRRELGAALYLGWASGALLGLGGGLLCCNCPPTEEERGQAYDGAYGGAYGGAQYTHVQTVSPHMDYV